jgi:hypothetical protein
MLAAAALFETFRMATVICAKPPVTLAAAVSVTTCLLVNAWPGMVTRAIVTAATSAVPNCFVTYLILIWYILLYIPLPN